MTEDLTPKQLKIFCPQHQTTFEVDESPKIVCETKGHALSNNFPNDELWEYCCDCQIFTPSDLEVGGKAHANCPHCERPTVARFICSNCKIVTFDSGEDTKGKIFSLNVSDRTIQPACPGCSMIFTEVKLELHLCEENQAVFLTSHPICPFCKKATVKAKSKPKIEKPATNKCPKCQLNNDPTSYFCNNCGETLRPNPHIANQGTSTAKTQLLGSICPNCGRENRPDSLFCTNCRQSLKTNPPPTPPIVPEVEKREEPPKPAPVPKNSTPIAGFLTVIGIVIGIIIFCVICQRILSNKNSTTPTNSSASNTVYRGSINGKNGNMAFTMVLKREGNNLSGTATTTQTDAVSGTIDNNGNFTLEARDTDGIRQTGVFRGTLKSDGSMSGTWTNLQGGQATPFYLSKN